MSELPRRTLGRTGLNVTTLGYGAMELRGAPSGPAVAHATAEKVLNAVLDAGINFIDTSIDYGQSEELIGRFIAHRRREYFLASKCGCVPGAPMGAEHVHTADNIKAGMEQSLRRMKTDYLDLVQFHRSLTQQELEEHGALDAALALKNEGKVRFLGVSGTLPNLVEQDGDGCLRRIPDPIFGTPARARGDYLTGWSRRGRNHHPWRSRARCA
jgi:aryl-alcohol dehydrogenase-like predicted oxidoreductase